VVDSTKNIAAGQKNKVCSLGAIQHGVKSHYDITKVKVCPDMPTDASKEFTGSFTAPVSAHPPATPAPPATHPPVGAKAAVVKKPVPVKK